MSFMVKNDDVLHKYNEIRDKINGEWNIKFHGMPVYDENYIKTKVTEFNSVIKTKFLGDEVPKESVHYTCMACITIYFVLRMQKRIIHWFI